MQKFFSFLSFHAKSIVQTLNFQFKSFQVFYETKEEEKNNHKKWDFTHFEQSCCW